MGMGELEGGFRCKIGYACIDGEHWEWTRMCVVTISSRYQVTIPKEIRERFNIMPGDLALFIPHGKTMGIVFARSTEELAEKKSLYKTSEFPPSGTMFENPDV
jgi:AbrB family looped-hinge helix DNA binding protein